MHHIAQGECGEQHHQCDGEACEKEMREFVHIMFSFMIVVEDDLYYRNPL